MRTTPSAASASASHPAQQQQQQQPPSLCKRKFLKRLLRCFASTSSSSSSSSSAKRTQSTKATIKVEEDMTSVVSSTSDGDGDQWHQRLHRGNSGDTVDMDTPDRTPSLEDVKNARNDDGTDDDDCIAGTNDTSNAPSIQSPDSHHRTTTSKNSTIFFRSKDSATRPRPTNTNTTDTTSAIAMAVLPSKQESDRIVTPSHTITTTTTSSSKRKSEHELESNTSSNDGSNSDDMSICCRHRQHGNYKRKLGDTPSSTSAADGVPCLILQPMLPQDVWCEICFYINDPVTLCRLACVSKELNQRVQDASPHIYQGLYQHRWIRSLSSTSSSSSYLTIVPSHELAALEDEAAQLLAAEQLAGSDDNDDEKKETDTMEDGDNDATKAPWVVVEDWKKKFQRRYAYEGHVVRTIQQVVLMELEPEICDVEMLQQSQYGRIASIAIEHDGWRRLLQEQQQEPVAHDDDIGDHRRRSTSNSNAHGIPSPPLDVLCAMANAETSYHPAIARVYSSSSASTLSSSSDRHDHTTIRPLHPRTLAKRRALLRFAAASTTFTFHCQEVITEMANVWERSLYQQIRHPSLTTTCTTQLAYEETAVLLSHALRTVPNLLERTSSLLHLQASVSQQLDQMAQVVQRHLHYYVDKRCCQQVEGRETTTKATTTTTTRELMFTLHYVLSKHYHIQSHLPIRSGSSGSDRKNSSSCSNSDDVLHSCSVSHVLLDYYHQEQREDVRYPNRCHPMLVAIIYQAVARRVGILSDILFCPDPCHTILRFSSSTTTANTSTWMFPKPSDLLFMDLVQEPGRIMTLPQCQELIRTSKLVTEQDYSERNRRMLFSGDQEGDRGDLNHDDNDEDMNEDVRTAFWSQPPISIPSVVYWLAAPFFTKSHSRIDEEDDDDDEDQPFDFLLGQLVESSGGGGGRLISFLQDRMVFFSSIMRHCKLIS